MQSTGNHKDHLAWVTRVLENQDGKCMFAINSAKKVAKERNLPIWQKFKHEEKSEEVTA